MKRIIILTTLFLGLSLFSQAQTATARIIEGDVNSHILLVYETGESKSTPLEKINVAGSLKRNVNAMVENQKIINKLIDDMKASGYEIVTISSTAVGVQTERFVIFEKE